MGIVTCLALAFIASACHSHGPAATAPAATSPPAPAPAAQNPSPMQERSRRHDRLTQRTEDGVYLVIDSILPRAVEVFVPTRALGVQNVPLLVHFMGATWVPQAAVASLSQPVVVASTYLGAGSGVYGRPFANDSLLYPRLLDAIRRRLASVRNAPTLRGVYLSGWSAGYGAIREIVKRPTNWSDVQGVLLLDGMHAGYVPDRKTLAEGGAIDSADVAPFLTFAQRAVRGEARFIIAHSEIFPGTFASTTETADWTIDRLGLTRTPVLEWGPVGMQLTSRAARGPFEVMGFAGNTAPDHVDFMHGMAWFVSRLLASN
jgi:hypothetical protein